MSVHCKLNKVSEHNTHKQNTNNINFNKIKGNLVYFDVSTGKTVTTLDTNMGSCDVIRKNPYNAVIACGHKNGVVTHWVPSNQKYVASMLCHKSKVMSIAIQENGHLMATTDNNGMLKIWDVRKFEELYKYHSNSAINDCTFSQKGLLAFSTGRTACVWNLKKDFEPIALHNNSNENMNEIKQFLGKDELSKQKSMLYLQHTMERKLVNQLQFCPYEDVLGIATTNGKNHSIFHFYIFNLFFDCVFFCVCVCFF